MTRFQAIDRADADALPKLEAMAATSDDNIEAIKLRWLARAYAAEVRCSTGDSVAGLAALALLQADMRAALPEGGHITRQVSAIRDACNAS